MSDLTSASYQKSPSITEIENEFFRPFIKHTEGFKYHEIAYILEIPVDLVKTRIKLAQRVLKYNINNYQSSFNLNL